VAIAFFDLDRTLLAVNSATLWLLFDWRAGRLRIRDAIRAIYWLTRYQLGAAKMEYALYRGIARVAGLAERDLVERLELFYQKAIRGRFRPGGLRAVQMHREKGDRLVLLTSAVSYLAERVQRELGLDDRLCTRFELDENARFTGRPIEPVCFGPGKIAYASRYAEEKRIPMSVCTFYTDSASDLPMLELVGHPVAVNPDVRLRRLATRRGWPIVDWGLPI
jgi:HAD superfamily hydrolase (TIGR01490 family)